MREFSIRNAGIKESKQIIRLNACIFNTNGLVFSARICRKYERTGQKIRNHLFRQRMRMQNDCLLVQDGYGLKNFNHPESRFKNGYERNLATSFCRYVHTGICFFRGSERFYIRDAGGRYKYRKENPDVFATNGNGTRRLFLIKRIPNKVFTDFVLSEASFFLETPDL